MFPVWRFACIGSLALGIILHNSEIGASVLPSELARGGVQHPGNVKFYPRPSVSQSQKARDINFASKCGVNNFNLVFLQFNPQGQNLATVFRNMGNYLSNMESTLLSQFRNGAMPQSQFPVRSWPTAFNQAMGVTATVGPPFVTTQMQESIISNDKI